MFDLQPTVDSIRIVRALLVFEKHLPFKIPTTVIRAGGYDSFDDMATDLLSKVKAIFNKKEPALLMREHSARGDTSLASEREYRAFPHG